MNDSHGRVHLDRQQILDATGLCLERDGYDATTIRRIAGELGCAVGSIYRYFTDKRTLLAALTQQPFEQLAAAAEAGLTLRDACAGYFAAANGDATRYRLMFWVTSLAPAGGAPLPVRLPKPVLRLVDQWARQLGDLRAAQRVWSALHGAILLGQDLAAALAAVQSAAGQVVEAETVEPSQPLAPTAAVVAEPVAEAIDALTTEAAEDVCLL